MNMEKLVKINFIVQAVISVASQIFRLVKETTIPRKKDESETSE